MMTNFVADHVRMCELPWRAELLSHHVKERQVEVNDAVPWAVEWASGSLALTASGGECVAEQPQFRLFVRRAALLKYLRPHLLRAAEHLRHELRLLIVGGRPLAGLGPGGRLDASRSGTTTHSQ